VRITGKRLRYSVECFEPVLPRQARSLVDATKRAQDLLGEHQDGAVTESWLRLSAAQHGSAYPPATLVRMGELMAQRRQRMVDIRHDWPATYQDVRRGWRRLRKSLKRARQTKAREVEPRRVERAVQRPFSLLQRFFRRRRGS
jgi:hypothetical protein